MKTFAAHATRAALLAAALFGASAAQAAAITIDFSGSPTSSALATGTSKSGDYSSLTFANGGVQATAVAGYKSGSTFTEGGGNNYPTLGLWSGNGLGVWSDRNDDEHTVDNKGAFEYVKFSFDQNVLIQSVTISCLSCDLSPGADASFLLGDLGGAWTEVSGPSGSLPSTYTFDLTGLLSTYDDVFRFGASQLVTEVQVQDGWEWETQCVKWNSKGKCTKSEQVKVPKYKTVKQYDDFKIKAVSFLTEPVGCTGPTCEPEPCTVNCEPEPCTGPNCNPAQVPEPSTLSILGLGALALAARVRRRKA